MKNQFCAALSLMLLMLAGIAPPPATAQAGLGQLSKEMDQLENQIKFVARLLSRCAQEVEQLKPPAPGASEKEVNDFERALEECERCLTGRGEQIAKAKARLNELAKQLPSAKEPVTKESPEVKRLRARAAALKQKLAEMEKRLNDLKVLAAKAKRRD